MRRPQTELARRAQRHATIDVGPEAIRQALAALSAEDCAMIYRSYYLGRTTAETAVELNTDDDTVKRHLHHAVRALRANVPKC